jgi:hypothetical protein
VASRGYKGAGTVSSRCLSYVVLPSFNELWCRSASRASAPHLPAHLTRGEPCSRRCAVVTWRWGNEQPLLEPCGAVCTFCVGADRHSADVHRGGPLAGVPRSRILRTHHGEIAGRLGPHDGRYRMPCPPLPRPLGVGSSQLGTLEDARPCLAGRGKARRAPSSLDRGRLGPIASARRERGGNSRRRVGRVHAWRVGPPDLNSVAHAQQAHGLTSVLKPERERDRPRRDVAPSHAMRLGALRDAPGPMQPQNRGVAQPQAGARAPPR